MSFPEYKEYRASDIPWLGSVPSHWHIDRLKRSVATCKNGIWGDDPQGDENDIACVRVADFDRDKLVAAPDNPTIRNVEPSELRFRRLRKGDLLLEKSGGGEKQPVGCVTLYDGQGCATCANFIARIELASQMSPSFWRYVHAALYSANLNKRSIKQTSGIQNLDQQSYLDEPVAFPPPEEQRQIADFLDHETARIDALIEEQRRLIDLLMEKRQSAISHAVTNGLDDSVPLKDSGVEWIGKIPRHWDVVPARALLREVDHRSQMGEEELLTVSHKTGVTRRRDKTVHMFMAESLVGYKLVANGDLVINTMWAWMGAMGCSRYNGVVSPSYNVYELISPERTESRFYDRLVRTEAFRQEAERHSQGVWQSRLRLYPEEFLRLNLPMPPSEEQKSIADHIETTDSKMDQLQRAAGDLIGKLRERRSALISAAVTGKIDVRERDHSPRPADAASPQAAEEEDRYG